MGQKFVQRCETEIIADACNASYRTQLSSCPNLQCEPAIQARAIRLLDMAQSRQDLDVKTSRIVTWEPRKGLNLTWLLFRSRHYR
jgi:hypothetical protein